MKSIEIKTTQNVVLQYELADLRDRIIAFVLDMVCLGIGIMLLSFVGYSVFSPESTTGKAFTILLICVFIFYSLVFEIVNHGQSIGKMAMRIRVVKTSGAHATYSDYTARWVFRMIDIYLSFGGIASILIASSSKGQRIGDIVANTAVVKLVPKMDLKLKDLLSIHSQDSYKPVFAQAKQLTEEDVLLIKTTLDRYQQFNNTSHTEAIELLADRIKAMLSIDTTTQNQRQFLQTVLHDYVVLTR